MAIANRNICDEIAARLTLSGAETATLNRMRSSYTQAGRLLGAAHRYLRIVRSEVARPTPPNAINVQVDHLAAETFEKPALVVEDEVSDGGLILFVLRGNARRRVATYISAQVINGGGSRLPDVFANRLAEKRIVCALVDSDASSPGGKKPQQLARLEETLDASAWRLGFVEVLPCREAENVIYLEVVSALRAYKGSLPLQTLEQIAAAEDCQASDRHWLFFDLKNGLSPEGFAKIENVSDQTWIKGKLQLVGLDPAKHTISGLGSKIIPQVLQDNRASARLQEVLQSEDWHAVFGNMVRRLSWVFFGAREQFT